MRGRITQAFSWPIVRSEPRRFPAALTALLFCLTGCVARQPSSNAEKREPVRAESTQELAPREAPDVLFEAINEGRLEHVKRMISADLGLLHATRIGGRTPLHQAAFCGERAMVAWLIAQGADVNARTDHGWTPLHYGAAPEDESSALLLIENGAEVNAANHEGDTPLHFAAGYGKLQMARALLQRGAKPAIPNRNGQTPRDVAESEGWEPMVDLLTPKSRAASATSAASAERLPGDRRRS